MLVKIFIGTSVLSSAGNGKRHAQADNKQEEGKDQVVKMESRPCRVVKLKGKFTKKRGSEKSE